ncbi:MAG: hypothetical protein KatS3mg101_1165 [Patescibacteria group bacterium]|nr:MAG: hypothetical protein KatS3mg101_1165 [Patescibacteria group bacterium]
MIEFEDLKKIRLQKRIEREAKRQYSNYIKSLPLISDPFIEPVKEPAPIKIMPGFPEKPYSCPDNPAPWMRCAPPVQEPEPIKTLPGFPTPPVQEQEPEGVQTITSTPEAEPVKCKCAGKPCDCKKKKTVVAVLVILLVVAIWFFFIKR